MKEGNNLLDTIIINNEWLDKELTIAENIHINTINKYRTGNTRVNEETLFNVFAYLLEREDITEVKLWMNPLQLIK